MWEPDVVVVFVIRRCIAKVLLSGQGGISCKQGFYCGEVVEDVGVMELVLVGSPVEGVTAGSQVQFIKDDADDAVVTEGDDVHRWIGKRVFMWVWWNKIEV